MHMYEDNLGDAVYDVRRRVSLPRRAGARPKPPAGPKPGQVRGYNSASGQPWLLPYFEQMVQTRQIISSLTPLTEIVLGNASAVFHGYSTVQQLYTACQSVINGAPEKAQGVAGASDTDLTVSAAMNVRRYTSCVGTAALVGTPCFGWKMRVTASYNNFAFRPIKINVAKLQNVGGSINAVTTASAIATYYVRARRLPVDIIILSPGNAGGIFTITPGVMNERLTTGSTSNSVGLEIEIIDANTFVEVESLNARDLVQRTVLPAVQDAVYDHGDDPHGSQPMYPGIRDAD